MFQWASAVVLTCINKCFFYGKMENHWTSNEAKERKTSVFNVFNAVMFCIHKHLAHIFFFDCRVLETSTIQGAQSRNSLLIVVKKLKMLQSQ